MVWEVLFTRNIYLIAMIRVQRKRTKGFKLPENTVCVNRGTKWGNPFRIEGVITRTMACQMFENCILNNVMVYMYFDFPEDAKQLKRFKWMAENLQTLQGKNLACFCGLSDECHADILLKLANHVD